MEYERVLVPKGFGSPDSDSWQKCDLIDAHTGEVINKSVYLKGVHLSFSRTSYLFYIGNDFDNLEFNNFKNKIFSKTADLQYIVEHFDKNRELLFDVVLEEWSDYKDLPVGYKELIFKEINNAIDVITKRVFEYEERFSFYDDLIFEIYQTDIYGKCKLYFRSNIENKRLNRCFLENLEIYLTNIKKEIYNIENGAYLTDLTFEIVNPKTFYV